MTFSKTLASPDAVIRPLALVDLDDTLFQTHHRIQPNASYRVATTDKHGQPLSFMSPTQWQFVQWLFQSTDVVAITARSVEALSRVQFNFNHGAVCSHGGAILNPDGTVDQDWQQHMQQVLAPYQTKLQTLLAYVQQATIDSDSIRTWIIEENNLGLYLVVKQNQLDPLFFKNLLQQIPAALLDGFYSHMNGRNLALIPDVVSKASATQALLKKQHLAAQPILGFGDSLSDVGFLSQCDWWGMPKHSQLNRWVATALHTQYTQEGYYGDYQ